MRVVWLITTVMLGLPFQGHPRIVNDRRLKADGFPDHLARVRIRGHRRPVLRPVYERPDPGYSGLR